MKFGKTPNAQGKRLCVKQPSLWFAAFFFVISSCQQNETIDKYEPDNLVEETLTASNPLLKLLPAEQTGIDFHNFIKETYEDNIATNLNKYNGGGVAAADFNNDGLQDIYFVACDGQNRLYLNLGNFQFKDITDVAGLISTDGFETAVTVVDINTDGFADLYVCRGGAENNEARRNKLYINNGISPSLGGGRGEVTFIERAH